MKGIRNFAIFVSLMFAALLVMGMDHWFSRLVAVMAFATSWAICLWAHEDVEAEEIDNGRPSS